MKKRPSDLPSTGDTSVKTQTTQEEAPTTLSKPASTGRRRFLGRVGAATIAAGVASQTAMAQFPGINKNACDDPNFPLGVEPADRAANRFMKSYKCRVEAAKLAQSRPLVFHLPNGDDDRYPNKIGSYTKGFPHNQLGEVDLGAYNSLVSARTSRVPADFEKITLGLGRPQTSPQAGLAMDLEGPDSHHVTLPPAPRFASAETAGEMVELYWMALARDVNFNDYDTNPIIAAAAEELSRLSDFRGPKQGGRVTPQTIFRSTFPGDTEGPHCRSSCCKISTSAQTSSRKRLRPPPLAWIT